MSRPPRIDRVELARDIGNLSEEIYLDDDGDVHVTEKARRIMQMGGIDERLLRSVIEDHITDFGDEIAIAWAGVEADYATAASIQEMGGVVDG